MQAERKRAKDGLGPSLRTAVPSWWQLCYIVRPRALFRGPAQYALTTVLVSVHSAQKGLPMS